MSTRRGSSTEVASSVPFDNTGTDFDATNVQDALIEIGVSASPGFSFGRSGAVNALTWLQCETVPSNKAGRFVYINTPKVDKLFISNELVSTFTIEIYEHEGDEVNLTLLDSKTVTSARGGTFTVDVNCTSGRQLALKLSSGSARNIVAGLQLSGTA